MLVNKRRNIYTFSILMSTNNLATVKNNYCYF
jgi:hypothetical protein